MCIYIGAEHGEDGESLRRFYAVAYKPEVLGKWPWGNEQFNCVIFACDPALARTLQEEIARDVVGWNVDWVQTTGADAERMHDLIDVAAVTAGRQNMVGEGHPMTSWHEDACTISGMAEVARLCLGGADQVLVLVVGDEADVSEVVQHVRHSLSDDTA